MTTKAIALCRVSTAKQRLEGTSLEAQESNVGECATYLDTEIEKIWSLDVSSRKGKNIARKDLKEMKDYCKHHKRIKYVIVDEADRWMRSVEEAYWWKMEFKLAGVSLAYANMPEITDMDDPIAVMREMMALFQGEVSNHERITKAKSRMRNRMLLGYYPFAPLPGYQTTETTGLHEPDPDRFKRLQTAFRSIVRDGVEPGVALKKMNTEGYRTHGGNEMDMERFKQIGVKSYYCGRLEVGDWGVVKEKGLHVAMLTVEEHEALKAILSGKKRKFVVNKKNPEYPMNETLCYDCWLEQNPHGKLTGYRNHNGKEEDEELRTYYQRYRCRGCKAYFTRQELHDEVSHKLDNTILEDRELLVKELRSLWRSEVSDNQNKLTALKARVNSIEQQQTDMATTLATTASETVKRTLETAIEKKEQDKLDLQK